MIFSERNWFHVSFHDFNSKSKVAFGTEIRHKAEFYCLIVKLKVETYKLLRWLWLRYFCPCIDRQIQVCTKHFWPINTEIILRVCYEGYSKNMQTTLLSGAKLFFFKSNFIGAPQRHKHKHTGAVFKIQHHRQDKTPPFHENWKAPFSHLSVTIKSAEWQVHFSDHPVTVQCHSVTIRSPFSNIYFPFFLL